MNRHQKFYTALSGMMDDDDDEYYDEDEDEYYEEGNNEGYYNNDEAYDEADYGASADPAMGGGAGAGALGAPVVHTHTAIHPDVDADYDVLDAVLPALHDAWKTQAPMQLPLTEGEAVDALRAHEYNPDACVPVLVAKRVAEKKSSGAGAKVLKVVSSKKPEDSANAKAAAASEGDEDDEDGPESGKSAQGAAKTGSAGKAKKGKKDKYMNVQPDMSKPDCTFVITGHVDAGKSTTLGHLLLLLGRVDASEVEKNEKQGRSSHKESFKYAWLLDQSEEERRRGVTIDAGSYCFETPHRRVHVLDAPGHKDFVLNMISSATQADAALMVVTAAPSEFETGLQYGTKDHLMILKTLGVGCIIVVVNKMDAAGFSHDRFKYVVDEVKLLLKQLRLKSEVVTGFVPISGMEGTNILHVDKGRTPWYEGPSLIELLDTCSLSSRLVDSPLRLSLQDIQGNTLFAKVESGRLTNGASLRFVPCNVQVDVKSIDKPTVGGQVNVAFAGDTVEIHTASSLTGLYHGTIGILNSEPYTVSAEFEAHVQTLPSLKRAVLPGATFVMAVHALTVPVKVTALVAKMDGKGVWSKGMVKCVPANAQALIVFQAQVNIAVVPAEDCPALGRFILQQDGEAVAGGLVKRVVPGASAS